MSWIEKTALIVLAVLMAALTVTFNLELWEDDQYGELTDASNLHIPDYYIDTFVATLFDERGTIEYELFADRYAHFPDDGSSLLDNPLLVQYPVDQGRRRIEGESGWINGAGDELLVRGNVKVREDAGPQGPGNDADVQQMRVKLKPEN